jgi:hypothetical protein
MQMSEHDPRLDMGRLALIAQLDEALAKVSQLARKLNEANTENVRLEDRIERLKAAP